MRVYYDNEIFILKSFYCLFFSKRLTSNEFTWEAHGLKCYNDTTTHILKTTLKGTLNPSIYNLMKLPIKDKLQQKNLHYFLRICTTYLRNVFCPQ